MNATATIAATQPAALDVDHISYGYNGHPALTDVCLRCDTGALFGILGPNGSGKTTLFRLVCALLMPDRGRVTVLGLDPADAAAAVRGKLGIVFQSGSLDARLTVAENLRYSGYMYGLWGASLRQRVTELAADFAFGDRLNDTVGTLSGGLRRRVELARAMLHRPPVLVLDEPTAGLDPEARDRFWQRIEAIRRRDGVTAIFTTHLFEEAVRSTSLAILDEGRVAVVDAPTAMMQDVAGDVIHLRTDDDTDVAAEIRSRHHVDVAVTADGLRIESGAAAALLVALLSAFGDRITSVSSGKSTLADVYRNATGKIFQ